MSKHPNGAAIGLVCNDKYKILLQKKDEGYLWHPGLWCFFGGAIEKGEDPITAFNREAIEEGIRIRDVEYFDNYDVYDVIMASGERRDYKIHAIRANLDCKVSDIRVNEGEGFGFFSRQEVEELPIVWHNKKIVQDFYEKI
jgi:8-oxo-dGTP pyrophosphatase MutT (NUDIX family)